MLNGGKFYGMTEQGGSNNKGVIFEWDPTTNVFIHKIDFDVSNGSSPQGSLTLKGGKIYGMTSKGGSGGLGVIFEWDPELNLFSKRIEWGSPNGSAPYGSLASGYGKLYGMTNKGGSSDKGVIFEFDPASNRYTKKVDFNGINGSYPFGSLTMSLGKFYGMTSQLNPPDNADGYGVIFEWDPVSNIFVKKIDFPGSGGFWPLGTLAISEGKFYGTTTAGGKGNGVIFEWDPLSNIYTPKQDIISNGNDHGPYGGLTLSKSKFYGMINGNGRKGSIDFGVIFEWDPASNMYNKKIDFDGYNGLYPTGGLTLFGDKFYGMTTSGGSNFDGVIFEWDPVTNVSTKKMDFNGIDGIRPYGSLTLSGGKLYGMTSAGGNYGAGVIFEWNPLTNVYTKKKDFVGTDGANPTYTNNLTLAPAPVAKGLYGSCINFPSVTIDNSNNNQWVSIIDEQGDAVAEIKANGNSLGIVNASIFINNGAVREDESKRLYLDRNIAITPQIQPKSPVDIRLYIKGSEYDAIKNAVNSNSKPSGISSINDVGIYKVDSSCSAVVSAITNPIVTTAANWGTDYVFSASITSFSSFYFAGKCQSEPPHITEVCVTPATLWPPNHQMKNVTVNYKAWSNCGAITSSLSVKSNEPVNGTGDGDTSPDWVILDNHHLQLRAERSGRGNGRIYTISITCTNASGNTSTEKIKVVVPHNNTSHSDDNHGSMDGTADYNEGKFDCKVMPNPSKQYFSIQITSASDEKIEANLLDENGRLISKLNTVKNQLLRFGDNLRPGVYLVEITQGEQHKTIRVVKQ